MQLGGLGPRRYHQPSPLLLRHLGLRCARPGAAGTLSRLVTYAPPASAALLRVSEEGEAVEDGGALSPSSGGVGDDVKVGQAYVRVKVPLRGLAWALGGCSDGEGRQVARLGCVTERVGRGGALLSFGGMAAATSGPSRQRLVATAAKRLTTVGLGGRGCQGHRR